MGIVGDSARYVVNQAGQVGSRNTRGTVTEYDSSLEPRGSCLVPLTPPPRFPLLSLFPETKTSETC